MEDFETIIQKQIQTSKSLYIETNMGCFLKRINLLKQKLKESKKCKDKTIN